MPFRERFDCLWCGTRHVVRTAQDLEGWASLCPTCVGRAGDNGFLRARLRTALTERSRAVAPAPADEPSGEPTVAPAPADEPSGEPTIAAADEDPDAFYRRSGRFSAGAIQDGAWLMELDAVTAWVDRLGLGPVVVELGAGGGWWSPLLASSAELWAYDPSDAALERLRRRLVAHGLRAHLHRRDLDAPADRTVDAVFAAFALGATGDDVTLDRRLEAIAGWLAPGGAFAFVEAAPAPGGGPVAGPRGPLRPLVESELTDRLRRHGLRLTAVAPGSGALIAGVAELVRPEPGTSAVPGTVEPEELPVAGTPR